jgi:hypothetical protein
MVVFSKKIIKFLTDLGDYHILHRKKDHLMVGTRITINESKGTSANPMQFGTILTKEKDFNVYFIAVTTDKGFISDSFFFHNHVPILSLDIESLKSLNAFEKSLDQFMKKSFYYP